MLLILSPILIAAAAAIAISDGRPVFFRQTRVGQKGRPFEILKFRTMTVGSDNEGVARLAAMADRGEHRLNDDGPIAAVVRDLKSESEARVTRIGAVLRKTSVDELPQLINVVRGDMSLVGPAAPPPFEVAGLNEWQLRAPGSAARSDRSLAGTRTERRQLGRAHAARLQLRLALVLRG